MSKIHDKFVIELAEVIKGYGNDPDVDDPFRLSEFYRFYELPEIAVSANHFKTMIPLEVVEKNAQPGWIPTSVRLPEDNEEVLFCDNEGERWLGWHYGFWKTERLDFNEDEVVAWMPLPTPYREGGQDGKN